MKHLLFILLIIAALAGPAFSETWLRVPYPMTMRQRGMGDAFTAVADDFYLLFTNPAGLRKVKNMKTEELNAIIQLPLLDFGFGIQNDVIRTLKQMQGIMQGAGEDESTQFTAALDALALIDRTSIGFSIEDPFLASGFLKDTYGFNIAPFMFDVNLKPVAGMRPELYIDFSSYIQGAYGLAPIHLPLFSSWDLDIGFAIKVLALGQFEGAAELVDFFVWGEDQSVMIEYLQNNLDLGIGLGLNTGAILDMGMGIALGLAVNDLPTVFTMLNVQDKEERLIKMAFPNMRAGISYSPDLRSWGINLPPWLLDNPVAAFDLTNLFDPRYKFWTKSHLGFSVNVIHTEPVSLNISAGLNKGYGTFSATLRAVVFHISYALWQDENGIKAGDYPVWQHIVKIALRW